VVSETPKKPRRSRRAEADEPRKIFPVKLSTTEREQLDQLASQRGVTVGRLLVESALSASMPAADRLRAIDELNRLNRLLANVAGNVNQIAYQANVAGQVIDRDGVREALESIHELRVQARDALRHVA
jgi:hypothetical protein